MKYELDYKVYRPYSVAGVYERECGTVCFGNVHAVQEFCESPEKMLRYFDAERGTFELRCGERPFEWEWVWKLEYDSEAQMNRLPIGFRQFRDAIFAVE